MTAEEIILKHFHGFTSEQWQELKLEFPYCEIEPIMTEYARQVGEAVKRACIEQIEMIFKDDGDLERDIKIEDYIK